MSSEDNTHQLDDGASLKEKDPEALHDVVEQQNSDLVDWDGPNDPANPMNWSSKLRVGHVVIISSITLIVFVTLNHNPLTKY